MAKVSFKLEATKRHDLGKGASRRLRRLEDLVPGIVYGGSKKPESISLSHRALKKALENEAFYSHILSLTIDGETEKVILKAMQRHPYKPVVQHLDFQRVDMNKPLHMNVPLHFINQEVSPGVKEGGLVSHQISELAISCLPSDLPEFIEVDLANMQLNDILHISDIKLPKGVTATALHYGPDSDVAIATIHLPRIIKEEEAAESSAQADDQAKEQSETKEDKKDTDSKK